MVSKLFVREFMTNGTKIVSLQWSDKLENVSRSLSGHPEATFLSCRELRFMEADEYLGCPISGKKKKP